MKQEMNTEKFIFEPNLPRLSDQLATVKNSTPVSEYLDLVPCSICKNKYESEDFYDLALRICIRCEKKCLVAGQ
jgi:hypothetical protein